MRESTYITLCWAPFDLADVGQALNRITRRLRACDDSPQAVVLSKQLAEIRRELQEVSLQLAAMQPSNWKGDGDEPAIVLGGTSD